MNDFYIEMLNENIKFYEFWVKYYDAEIKTCNKSLKYLKEEQEKDYQYHTSEIIASVKRRRNRAYSNIRNYKIKLDKEKNKIDSIN